MFIAIIYVLILGRKNSSSESSIRSCHENSYDASGVAIGVTMSITMRVAIRKGVAIMKASLRIVQSVAALKAIVLWYPKDFRLVYLCTVLRGGYYAVHNATKISGAPRHGRTRSLRLLGLAQCSPYQPKPGTSPCNHTQGLLHTLLAP